MTSCILTNPVLRIIGIGASHRFVMDALLAFSAEHISNITGCPMVGKMAVEHRGHALNGLSQAIANFTEENSDAVLAASLTLSWQATDWCVRSFIGLVCFVREKN